MEISEMFLISWAVVATTFGVWAHSRAKHHFMSHIRVAELLAEVVVGDVTPTKNNDGSWTVENDYIKTSFRRKGD
jgi:hypothetical protein